MADAGKASTEYPRDDHQPEVRREDPFRPSLHVAGRAWQEALPDAWGAAGSGAPKGNQNALKSGFFTRQAIEERKQVRALLRNAQKFLSEIE